jgi:hypothetical protein
MISTEIFATWQNVAPVNLIGYSIFRPNIETA